MFKIISMLFLLKTGFMFVIIQQIKSFSVQTGAPIESNYFNEFLVALLYPGIFGLIILVLLTSWGVSLLIDKYWYKV